MPVLFADSLQTIYYPKGQESRLDKCFGGEHGEVVRAVANLGIDIEDIGRLDFELPFGIPVFAIGNRGVPGLERLCLAIPQVLTGIRVVRTNGNGLPDIRIKIDRRGLRGKRSFAPTLIVLCYTIAITQAYIGGYPEIGTKPRGIGLRKAFIKGALPLDKLIDFAVVKTRIQRGPYLSESTLNTAENACVLIGEGGIKKGAGANYILEGGKASYLVNIVGIRRPYKNIRVIEQVKAAVKEVYIVRERVLQFCLAELNTIKTIEHNSPSQTGNICKLVAHLVAQGQRFVFLELNARFKVREEAKKIVFELGSELGIAVAVSVKRESRG